MTEPPFYDEAMARKQEQLAMTPDMQTQRAVVLEALRLAPGERVVEVGSGNGIMAREMAAIVGKSGHVCGVDSSEAMIAMAGAICPDATFLLGDATDLPLDDASFDVATASQLLCFVPAADVAVAEMARVLRPGGRVAILDTDWGSLVWNCRNRELMDRAIRMLTGPYADAHVPRTLSKHLAAAGFEVAARKTHTILNWRRDGPSYSQQTAGFIESMMASSDAFTDEDWTAWQADQKTVADAGEFMFSLNRYIFVATKR